MEDCGQFVWLPGLIGSWLSEWYRQGAIDRCLEQTAACGFGVFCSVPCCGVQSVPDETEVPCKLWGRLTQDGAGRLHLGFIFGFKGLYEGCPGFLVIRACDKGEDLGAHGAPRW